MVPQGAIIRSPHRLRNWTIGRESRGFGQLLVSTHIVMIAEAAEFGPD
jgi:hypothetical protein